MVAVNKFGRVGVLYGGNSAERAISLRSGHAVLQALKSQGIDAVGVDVNFDEKLITQLKGFDRVFIALHGRGGEDGIVQAILTLLEIPYTGSDVMSSALGMDKLRCKQLWLGCGLSTPEFTIASTEEELEPALEKIGFPIMVKPPHEGSSIGMAKADNLADLHEAFQNAKEHDEYILLEKWIQGQEYTCAILNGQALPVIRLVTPNDFYDFQAKYESNQTQYLCPCGLTPEDEEAVQQLSLAAFNAVGCRGWGRVDLMRDEQGVFYLLEVNTVPGMTDHSLVPMAAKASGMDFKTLALEIIKGATV